MRSTCAHRGGARRLSPGAGIGAAADGVTNVCDGLLRGPAGCSAGLLMDGRDERSVSVSIQFIQLRRRRAAMPATARTSAPGAGIKRGAPSANTVGVPRPWLYATVNGVVNGVIA